MFFYDKKWIFESADIESFSLSDSVVKNSFMLANFFSICIYDITFLMRNFLFKKFFKIYFSDKTKSLAIFSLSIGKSDFFCYFSDFNFFKISDREEAMLKLKLIEKREKIRLVFSRVNSFKEMKYIFFIFLYSCIMSCSNKLISESESFFKKKFKFYFTITKYIRIGSNSFLISLKNIMKNFFFIFFDIIKSEKIDSQKRSNFFCDFQIFFCRASCFIFGNVVYHKTSIYFISSLLQKINTHSTIDSAGKSNKNFFLYHFLFY